MRNVALTRHAGLVLLAAVFSSASCAAPAPPPATPAASATAAAAGAPVTDPSANTAANPLLAKWTGPYGGVPPFAKVKVEHFKPALEAAMDESRKEIAKIANDPSQPTFDNTIAAMEDTGRTLDRVSTLYGVWSGTMNSPDFQIVEREMAPKLAAYEDEVHQNAKLFQRIEAVYTSPDKAKLTPEQQRLTWRHYTTFVRAGARLDATAKKTLTEYNQRLAALFTTFSQNVLADEETALILDNEADLAGLPDSFRAGAAADAEGRKGVGHGKWAIANTRSAMEPFLSYSTRSDLREKVWRSYVSRGDNNDAHDNKKTIAEILKIRAQRAKLLGYPTHAHWRLENTMAKTPERAMALMESVWTPAVALVHKEVQDMQALADADKERLKRKIAPWDYRFYSEKVRKAKFALDEDQVKPYLQLDRLREGMFWVAGELFGFTFTPVASGATADSEVQVYQPDLQVYEVKDKATGKHVGLWYFDPYARQGKHSGAWMNAYRNQERFKGEVTTIVSNNANFVKGKPGEPLLISWIDAQTLFHEFGHALHGLSSNVNYPTLSGTSVPTDYVEFPSQLLEHWLSTPEVLDKFARHYQTGAPIPKELVAKIKKAATFNEGFATVEYLSAALIDMKLHLAGDKEIDPDAFERDTLTAMGMPKEIVMRHRTAQFSHVFSSDQYSAGYYSYLWSDALTADAYEAFTEAKGPYDPAVAERLRKYVFTVGDTIDPAVGYKSFRGRDVDTAALMRKRGLPVPNANARAKAAANTK